MQWCYQYVIFAHSRVASLFYSILSGFEWRTRKYDLVSWDENFQNLMKFGTENQHYNVPAPIEGSELTKEQEETNRFYKWVKRTRAEYKSLVNGKSSRMLTEDRVAKLRQIGFIV